MAFITEDFTDISVEELEDWGDLVLSPEEEELGVSNANVGNVSDREGEDHEQHDEAGSSLSAKAKQTELKNVAKSRQKSSKKKENQRTAEAKPDDQEVQQSASQKADKKKQSKVFFVLSPDTRRKMESEAVSTIRNILQLVSSEERFSGKHGYGGDVKSMAQRILAFENSDLENMSMYMFNIILDIVAAVDKTPVGASLQEEIFKRFHIVRLEEKHRDYWREFLNSLRIDSVGRIVGNLLYQFMLEKVLQKTVSFVGSQQVNEKEANPRVELNERELQVLRYVSGFIPYALLKRYRRGKSPLAKEYIRILQSWRASQDKETMAPSFLAYTIAWMEMQNRGGLFCVTDDVFRFFWACERVAKPFLNRKKIGELRKTNLKTTLFKSCAEDNKVTQQWNSLICRYSINTDMKPLFHSILNYFTKIRITAFVKAFNLVEKQAKRASSKGQRSLRKELAK
ncbi:uncharacterized protein LOC121424755 isoform X2 [Lytechinus variegatus]|uniref:uncharacterized protein LOC121424755 isoform X2 n=1 Tax=Lytechinus variegatus TaxID=7654 RepID=UPI001BB10F3D|nr:uncharacterized protein LOC121424755 isoform X2 [Lytechinus variegatus]